MSTILVTGGAGYVGAHCCLALAKSGHHVIVYDNLSTGHASFVKWGRLVRGDVRDRDRLRSVFAEIKPDAVLHCAARSEVGPSVSDPARFYGANVAGSLAVLDAMRHADVHAFVFSSSCAIYGAPAYLPIDEAHPQAPLNPYGRTKAMIEQASADYAGAYGLRFAHLRYFNAAGSAHEDGIGESHHPETHAIPLALRATRARPFQVYGADYATVDGSCERDYVHVLDLAEAHVGALERLLGGGESLAVNLGSGRGVSVLELVRTLNAPHVIAARREGDAPALVADISRAKRELNWAPKRSFADILASAACWESALNPARSIPA